MRKVTPLRKRPRERLYYPGFRYDGGRRDVKGLLDITTFLRICKVYAVEKAEWIELAEHFDELIGDCHKRIAAILRSHPPRPRLGEAIGARDYPSESIKAMGGRLVMSRKDKR